MNLIISDWNAALDGDSVPLAAAVVQGGYESALRSQVRLTPTDFGTQVSFWSTLTHSHQGRSFSKQVERVLQSTIITNGTRFYPRFWFTFLSKSWGLSIISRGWS